MRKDVFNMAFCKYCGASLDNDSLFCASCGARVTQTAPVPQVQGRGLAIASLILSIIGLAAGFGMLMVSINMSARPSMLMASILYYPIPLLAALYAANARRKGYVYGISKSGLTMGFAGLTMITLAMSILLIKL